MTFDQIVAEWAEDSKINKAKLDDEGLRIPKLHHKYYTMFMQARVDCRRLDAELKKLKLAKYEFYTQGHTEETKKLGWRLPPRGMILKGDIPLYMDADQDLIDATFRLGVAQEKVDFVESIIKSFTNRGYIIKAAQDFQKFQMGG